MQRISASFMFNSFFLPNNIVSRNDKVGFHDVNITQLPLCGRRSITTIPALSQTTQYHIQPFSIHISWFSWAISSCLIAFINYISTN